jgi:uncharacterized protein HemY
MRRASVVLAGGVAAAAGCFAPFAWPDGRHASPDSDVVQASATVATPEPEDHLARAADCVERGDNAGALPHLSAHVAAHPEAVMIRAYLAELLLRAGRPGDARPQFERVVADAQRTSGPARGHLVHCHTRLMEIAAAGHDGYAEELHRGVGLLLLVRKWDADPDRRDAAEAERTLAKAARALRSAAAERPHDPRANLYLGDVYERLGQPSAARAAWRSATAGLPDPGLTTAERDRLAAATAG